jgi:ubiquinone/menaquinone biosynthesis C-methylase UbiE
LNDWLSYDGIARRYDDVCGSRFEAVAGHLWALMPPAAGATVLDIGTGTGIVPRALGARAGKLAAVIGCDTSAGMLSMARLRMPALKVVAAGATDLPFREATFGVITASFVLSHLPDYAVALREAYRVLRPSGVFAMTSWGPSTDPYSDAWGRLLIEAVSSDRLQEAVAQGLPSEGFFENAERVAAVLTEAGFSGVEVRTASFQSSFSLDLYLADRQLTLGGRFARHVLGPEDWPRFIANAREELRRSFGSHVSYSRGVLIGLGHRPGGVRGGEET